MTRSSLLSNQHMIAMDEQIITQKENEEGIISPSSTTQVAHTSATHTAPSKSNSDKTRTLTLIRPQQHPHHRSGHPNSESYSGSTLPRRIQHITRIHIISLPPPSNTSPSPPSTCPNSNLLDPLASMSSFARLTANHASSKWKRVLPRLTLS
ncbi:unnamed protein product [Periconia digitata]|uniref:Uncharacterized protein n=1 Tax=Periconia digitata TaxID=1303443 RepID=A0A9W4XJD2_9PLEO|nr:unnamed protein product [Periconia digitata]